MAKKNIYLTEDALRELAEIVSMHNERINNAKVAYIDKVDLITMDEGFYSLRNQCAKVSLAYRPEVDGKYDPTDKDEYVIVLS